MSRTGIGFDFHRLVVGRPLRLGGVSIPYSMGLLGHSDADSLVHAVCDALLGAAGLGDIGVHYPDTDPRYKGINSVQLLEDARLKLAGGGWSVEYVDSIIIAQDPKLSPYYGQMKIALAKAVGISSEQVNVKAKTMEGFGDIGRGEGIAAWAVATISKQLV